MNSTSIQLPLLKPTLREEVKAAWDEEIAARVKDVEEGRVELVSADESLKRIRAKLAARRSGRALPRFGEYCLPFMIWKDRVVILAVAGFRFNTLKMNDIFTSIVLNGQPPTCV